MSEKQTGQIEKIPIRLKIDKDSPLDLTELSRALLSLNNSIDEYVATSCGTSGAKTTLESVEKGSDIFNMAVVAAVMFGEALPMINAYFEFFSNIKNIGKRSVDEIKGDKFLTETSLDDIENIVNLASQSGVSLAINYNNYKDCVIINQENKNAYKQGIATVRQIKDFENKEVVKKTFNKMSITLYQTTNTDKKVKFRAYCYELSDRAIPILIDDENLKTEILENPYNYRFVCDIEIYKDANGKISLYRAFNYVDKFEIIKDDK